ncbi:MAG: hypothetical protein VB081_08335 [Christensenella sp.]|uniref:hypothetical protein n=1 Tax=Christensenella sp. TaxID=1935934 RepID=UPI002B20887E|nr:hypothetical protein [Christensenella sp.]MEA5003491.1 hypothetical protein [Christensenella sp.]
MKQKTRKGLIIAGTIAGWIAAAILVLVVLSGMGVIDFGRPNLIFDTYKGKPVYQELGAEKDSRWADIVIEGELYTHRNSTPWRAKAVGEVIGYGNYMGGATLSALRDDPNRDFLQLDTQWGTGIYSELYRRASIELPPVDEQTINEIRFYKGEDDYQDTFKEKTEMQLLFSTRDKGKIKQLIDEMKTRDGIDPLGAGSSEYLGILQFLNDEYPMLDCTFTVWYSNTNEYELSNAIEDDGAGFIKDAYNIVTVSLEILEPLLGE